MIEETYLGARMSDESTNRTSRSFWRSRSFPPVDGADLWVMSGVLVLMVVAMALVAVQFIPKQPSPADKRASYSAELSKVYGATDVVFSASDVTMTVKGQGVKCEDLPAVEKLKDHPILRCVPLTLVTPVDGATAY